MMTTFGIPLTILAAALILAVIMDVRFGRIPNWLTFSLMLTAPVYFLIRDGSSGFVFSLSGIGVGMATLICFYIAGGMGAGDVKLMGAVGAVLGPKSVFLAFLGTAIVGGIYALGLLAWHGKLRIHFRKYWQTLTLFLFTRTIIYVPDAPEQALPRLRYGVAIATGTLLSLGTGSILLG